MRKKFDRLVRERLKAEVARGDVVAYLAQRARLSPSYVSQLLQHRLPRRNSDGFEYVAWRKIKSFLNTEEIEIIEGVKYDDCRTKRDSIGAAVGGASKQSGAGKAGRGTASGGGNSGSGSIVSGDVVEGLSLE